MIVSHLLSAVLCQALTISLNTYNQPSSILVSIIQVGKLRLKDWDCDLPNFVWWIYRSLWQHQNQTHVSLTSKPMLFLLDFAIVSSEAGEGGRGENSQKAQISPRDMKRIFSHQSRWEKNVLFSNTKANLGIPKVQNFISGSPPEAPCLVLGFP